jgi:uncharacterized protein YndB with AHSA1/START domain
MSITPLFHGSFSLTRVWGIPPVRVFSALSNPQIKAKWFIGPSDRWTMIRWSLDFRQGGEEVLEGRFNRTGMVTLYEARIHFIEENARLVYTYDMYLNGAYNSASLASFALAPEGAGTRLTYTEQIVFVDGEDGIASRRSGMEAMFKRIEALELA